MAFSLASFLASSIAITILIGVLVLILNVNSLVPKFGLGCIYFLLFLILLRGFIPIEFYSIKLTRSFYSEWLFLLNEFLNTEIYMIGSFSVTPMKVLYIIWGIGAVYHLTKGYFEYKGSKNRIYSLPDVTDSEMLEVFQSVYQELFPKNTIRIRLVKSNSIKTPAIFLTRHPVLLMPDIPYTANELRYVFMHEFFHCKHKDYLTKILLNILASFHWWNPVISRLLLPVIMQIQELLVDYDISKRLDKIQKIEYLQTLRITLGYQKEPEQTKLSTFIKRQDSMLQRFHYITNTSAKSFTVFGVVVCLLLFVMSFTFVFEPFHEPTTDENGRKVWRDEEDGTYYVVNKEGTYDLYMQNEYVATTDEILETFKDVPIYESLEDVP